MSIFTASIFYRAEKSFGAGRTAHQRHKRIVGGWRAEVIDGLPDGVSIYTGVCADRDEVKRELIDQLKRNGFSGTLRFA